MISYIRSKGMSLDAMGDAVSELCAELLRSGRSEYLHLFQDLFGFKNLGYSKPLSQEQLQSYIDRFGPEQSTFLIVPSR